MSQENKLAVLQALLTRVQARQSAPRVAHPPETLHAEGNGNGALTSEDAASAAANTRRSAVHAAPAEEVQPIAAPAEELQPILALEPEFAGESEAEVAPEPSREPARAPVELDDTDEGSMPTLTHGDLISEVSDDDVPPSAPRVRHDDGREVAEGLADESSGDEERQLGEERPITEPPESGRQVASGARDLPVATDDALDEIDIAIDIPEAEGLGAPRRPLDSIDLTAPDVAESAPPPVVVPSVVLAAERPAAPPARDLDGDDFAWPPSDAPPPPVPQPAEPTAFTRAGRVPSSQPPRLEVVEEKPRTGALEPIAHLVDPFPPPGGRSSVPPAPAIAARSDAPASDAPPTQWSEAPPPMPIVAAAVAPLTSAAPSFRLMVAPSAEAGGVPVEVWASTYAPGEGGREAAAFLGATATFAPETFADLLAASLALGD